MTQTVEDKHTYGAEDWRAPDIDSGDTILFSEHGRDLENICYCSHYYRLVREEFGGYALLVKHGGGQERVKDWDINKIIGTLELLNSDNRYLTLSALYNLWHKGRREGREETATIYRKAFVDGRLKKRKMPKQNAVKVWIESAMIERVGA